MVRTARSGGNASDDASVTDDQWAFVINYYRAKLTKDRAEAGKRIPEALLQNLGRIELERKDEECPEESGCILGPVKPLPKAVGVNGRQLFTYVGTDQKPFSRTSSSGRPWTAYRRWTGTLPYWFVRGGDLRVYQPPTKGFRYMKVVGVFEDPLAAKEYRECPGQGCVDYSMEYPFPLDMVDTMLKMIAQAELTMIKTAIEDESNNAREDTLQKGPPAPPPGAGQGGS